MMRDMMLKRQLGNNQNGDGNTETEDDYGSWWFSPAGMAIRYSVVAIFFAVILLYFVGGSWHAKRRAKKGLSPLSYHRWMLRRPQPIPHRYPFHPDPSRHGYPMETYQPPPPAYNNSELPPPTYEPPMGGTKAMPDQSYTETTRVGESSTSSLPAAPPAAAGQH